MTAARVQFEIHKGITFGPVVIYVQGEGGSTIDLTDWAVHAQARRASKSPVAFTLPLAITDASAGQISFTLTDEQTAALPAGTYLYDVILGRPDGSRLGPVIAGPINVNSLITIV